jgi:hypothetical protein
MMRIHPLSAAGGLVLLALALAGCETPATAPSFADIRFTQEPKLRIDAASIEVKEEFQPSFKAPNVEHLFPVPPERAMENWVQDRLVAAGSTRRVRVRILDASVRETALPKTPGVKGAFTTDQAERYDASVAMAIELLGANGFVERTARAQAQRSQSVQEGLTPNQRDQAWYDLTREVVGELDRELERQLRAVFTFYVQ